MSIRGACIVALAVLVGRDFSPAGHAGPTFDVGPNFSSAPQQPTFKSGVQMIEVDVRVFDKDGRFVGDLGLGDFEVVENGVPQELKTLFLVGETSPTSVGPNFSSASAEAGLKSGPTEAPHESARQTWIFFFDLNHLTPGGGFDRARKGVEEFVQNRFREGDMAGVIAGDKMVNNRLSSVREELVAAVKQVKPSNESRSRFITLRREWPRFQDEDEAIRCAKGERDALERVVARACAEQPDMCGPRGDIQSHVRSKSIMLQQQIHQASNRTMSVLHGLASGLAKVPGPKTIVFLSDGFVVQEVETTLRSVVGQTTRAGGRVYAIDVRGLSRGINDTLDSAIADDLYFSTVKFDNQADGPNSLAVDTGGVMIRNENNIGRALDAVARDSGRYYVLGYQPTNTNFDGKYRPIQVRVKRDGVRVRARRGYLGLAPSQLTLPQPIKPPER